MVLEMQQKLQQQWCFYMFLTKNGVAGVDSMGGHPPHPPGRGASVKWVSLFEWTHTGEKTHTIAKDATKSYIPETPQKLWF